MDFPFLPTSDSYTNKTTNELLSPFLDRPTGRTPWSPHPTRPFSCQKPDQPAPSYVTGSQDPAACSPVPSLHGYLIQNSPAVPLLSAFEARLPKRWAALPHSRLPSVHRLLVCCCLPPMPS